MSEWKCYLIELEQAIDRIRSLYPNSGAVWCIEENCIYYSKDLTNDANEKKPPRKNIYMQSKALSLTRDLLERYLKQTNELELLDKTIFKQI